MGLLLNCPGNAPPEGEYDHAPPQGPAGTPGAAPSAAGAASPQMDGKAFFRQARGKLSHESFNQFLASIKRLNSEQQTREETLQEARRLFGPEHVDLYSDFELILNRQGNAPLEGEYDKTPPQGLAGAPGAAPSAERAVSPQMDGKAFFRKARGKLSHESFNQFLASIKRLNNQQQTREETLEEVRRWFGPENVDLYSDFELLLNRQGAL